MLGFSEFTLSVDPSTATRSPQMLIMSGVGPRAPLKSLDITGIADRLGVGQNFWVRESFVVDKTILMIAELGSTAIPSLVRSQRID